MRKLLIAAAVVPMIVGDTILLTENAWAKSKPPRCMTSWSLENDISFNTDRNYTFGGLVAHSCYSNVDLPEAHPELDRPWFEPFRTLNKGWLDEGWLPGVLSPVALLKKPEHKVYSHFGGLLLYTPNDLTIPHPGSKHGRPYASLLFYGDSILHATKDTAIKQEVQVGMLGLPIGGAIQDAVHEVISADRPQGWSTQISHGGEPVFGYGLQKKKLLLCNGKTTSAGLCDDGEDDLTASWGISLGYYTSLRASFTGRLGLGGKLRSPFWGDFGPISGGRTFVTPQNHMSLLNANSSVSNVGNHPLAATASQSESPESDDETFLFATVGMDVVLYSAVLQGQFLQNDYEIDSSDVQRAVPYLSVGFVTNFGKYRLSVLHSVRGPEIEDGKSHGWTSFSIGFML